MSGKEEVLPLPDMPQSQQGTSTATGKGYTASVSNAAGYLCHIQLDATFDVPPEVIFEIFCHPDNAGAFRDIKCVGYRKVKQQEPGFKLVEVEQCGELRVLWIHRVFKTYLDVTEDARDPECLKTEFTLLRSDLLSRFFGSWELRPIKDGSGKVTGCRAVLHQDVLPKVLHQDVLPKGVPTFFAHLPVLGGLLRRVSLGTIQRLIEDILYIVKKYTDGNGKLSVDDCIAKIAEERGHKTAKEENRPGSSGGEAGSSSDNNNNAAVASFAIESFSESGSESEEEGEGEGEVAEAATKTQQEVPAAAAAAGADSTVPPAAANDKQREQQKQQQPTAGASSSTGSARASADGEVVIAPAADGSSKDESTTAAAVAAGAVAEGHKHKHHGTHKQHHKQQQQQQQQQAVEGVDAGSPAVGVLLDVSVHNTVHVGLITNPESA